MGALPYVERMRFSLSIKWLAIEGILAIDVIQGRNAETSLSH